MTLTFAARKRIVRSSRLALMLGLGTLSATAATADAMPADESAVTPPLAQQRLESSGELRVWAEDGRIFLAEPGGATRVLELGQTAEARRLHQLLDQAGATDAAAGMRLDRVLLAGGGGNGFAWAPQRSAVPATTATPFTGAGNQGHEEGTGVSPRESTARRPAPASTGRKID
jgi:hypothetical protein